MPGVVYHKRSELTSVLESSGYTVTVVANVKYMLLHALRKMILLRWQSNSQTANATNVYVDAADLGGLTG